MLFLFIQKACVSLLCFTSSCLSFYFLVAIFFLLSSRSFHCLAFYVSLVCSLSYRYFFRFVLSRSFNSFAFLRLPCLFTFLSLPSFFCPLACYFYHNSITAKAPARFIVLLFYVSLVLFTFYR